MEVEVEVEIEIEEGVRTELKEVVVAGLAGVAEAEVVGKTKGEVMEVNKGESNGKLLRFRERPKELIPGSKRGLLIVKKGSGLILGFFSSTV